MWHMEGTTVHLLRLFLLTKLIYAIGNKDLHWIMNEPDNVYTTYVVQNVIANIATLFSLFMNIVYLFFISFH